MRQVIHVETTCCHIGSYEQLHRMLAEFCHGEVTLLLRKITMKCLRIVAVAYQFVGHLLRLQFRTAEDDGKDARIIVHDTLQCGIFILGIHHIIDMVHVLGTLITAAYDDFLRVVEEVLGYLLDFLAHRCREEQRVTVLGNTGQNGVDVLRESHVEHLVGLVEHYIEHRIQLCHLAFHQVNQTSGCSHDDMHAFLQGANLRNDVRAAIDGHHTDTFNVFREIIQVVCNLQTKFTRRTEHDGLCLMRTHVHAL